MQPYAARVEDVRPSVLLSPPDSDVEVVFSGLARPHDDELTVFDVGIVAPGLQASAHAETLSGDIGLRLRPRVSEPDHGVQEMTRLSGFLDEISAAPAAWVGSLGWRSLCRQLILTATCDPIGHVTLTTTLSSPSSEPTWHASASITHPRGDLKHLAHHLALWFSQTR